MANWRQKLWRSLISFQGATYSTTPSRINKVKLNDLRRIRPMIQRRIENRAKEYPIRDIVPVAEEILKARNNLLSNVTVLLKLFPVLTCKFCSEVFIGKEGHLIQTCRSYIRRGNNRLHEWVPGSINDVLVPVESFHLRSMSQGVIRHQQRFDYDRVPAILELCCQAGAIHPEEILQYSKIHDNPQISDEEIRSIPTEDLKYVGANALMAWEKLRAGLKKLLLVYPSKVCKHCKEVNVGLSGHKARLCGVFKYESFRGTHYWEKAGVNDLVPEKVVWHRRPQDPVVLVDEGRSYYGHAPAVVSLCSHAGAVVPTHYACEMKPQGLSFPFTNSIQNCET
uniref:APO protein 4, mitochondrial n=1 Tax=Noccaea caerulescens TaxID=107243 RepID=A0A1J3GYT0_NOCCA